jgi:hypothetical protein
MLNIGWASLVITPPKPALIQGQMHIRIGREAQDPLTVTALVLDDGQPAGRVALVSADLAMISESLQAAVRDRLRTRVPDLPSEAIILNATHTHDGPVLDDSFYPHPGGDVMPTAEVLEWLTEKAAAAVEEAWTNRTPRRLGRAFGHAVVGHNRRAVYDSGLAVMYGKTNNPAFRHIEGYEDHSLDMLFVWEPDGALAGVALGIPCPSQVEENLCVFSADYWHEIRVELRQRFGKKLQVLPLCGAAGDQSPHFLLYGKQEEEMRRRNGLTERQEIARRVGDAVARALMSTPPFDGEPVVAHRTRRLAFSPRRITQEERDWAVKARADAAARGDRPDLWWPRLLDLVAACFDKGEPMPVFEGELHVLRIGDMAVATNPFELYQDFGLQIKARSRAAQTLLVQLACGTGLYLPSRRAVSGGHYGAHPVVAPVGPEGGQELVEATLAAIDELFPPS